MSRLPDKLRSGIDPESDPFDLDLSKASGLSKGLCLCLSLWLSLSLCLVFQKKKNTGKEMGSYNIYRQVHRIEQP